jgi:hypothetical protein
MTQFIAARFKPDSTRDYTYRNDGDPVAVGDFVKVEAARGEGITVIEVTAIVDKEPPFVCKPIIEKTERPDSWLAPTKGITDGQ